MRLTDVYTAKAVGFRLQNEASNEKEYIGQLFFPVQKKMGIDINLIKARKGLGVALKPSTYDALATIRPRKGFTVTAQQMPLFRESMKVSEKDMIEIARAQESNDPYLTEVLQNIYDDVEELVKGAEISAERMIMQLLAPTNGNVKIEIGLEDNTAYAYDYDADHSWKANHYMELGAGDASSRDKWDQTGAKPLSDIEKGASYLRSIGETPKYILMNSTTLDMLLNNPQIKNAIIVSAGVTVDYISRKTVSDAIQAQTGLSVMIYDKAYGTGTKFYPDNYVTIIGEGQLGTLYRGITPEERSLMADPSVDVTIVNEGIAVTVKTDYGPPVQTSTTVSEVCLPSFDGMDSIFVMKVA